MVDKCILIDTIVNYKLQCFQQLQFKKISTGHDDSIPHFSIKLIANRSGVPPVSILPVLSQPADQDWLHEIPGRVKPHFAQISSGALW
jgi:hypothetical protein